MSSDSIHFEGRFPYARVRYDGLDPVELQLETFSPFDLPDASEEYSNSSLPLASSSSRLATQLKANYRSPLHSPGRT